ncbi:DNA ligase D [Caenispirillum bisanense]|uniref:DNA ligase (ATP) n=1 Tax=Caenispirillum bisanense TaxID=414052 RepID=A0A286G0Z6_9PROT|nr:DNA ligase D [Caenispirillum bisanense]SOD89173.1 ATP-dependent DNA ligase LigD phosphoesterase module /ATP-dependent DNA ligase LigD polymerase module [Caenispirillum bisanense]
MPRNGSSDDETKPAVRAADALAAYVAKRDFSKTREPPAGKAKRRKKGDPPIFVVQKHAATRLHWDFRLEMNGVLASWAVTKGPSLDPADKRLAVHTEDHPLDYAGFEGTIPKGQYGGGTVMLWDGGTWELLEGDDPVAQVEKGKLDVLLHGQRMNGRWALVRMGGRRAADKGKDNWLLLKKKDDHARPGDGDWLVTQHMTSAVTDRPMDVIAAEEGEAPPPPPKPKTARRKAAASDAPPPFVAPQLATREARAPAGGAWLHEIKFDGYRMIGRLHGGKASLLTRTGKDWTTRFKALAEALAALPADGLMVDGEIVVLDDAGASDFGLLQEAIGEARTDAIVFQLFDCVFLDGEDLRDRPLVERKERLRSLLEDADLPEDALLRYSDHIDGAGPRVWEKACSMSLEGVVSKRRDAPYRSGRGRDWVKSKCIERQEFVVGGFTAPTTGGPGLGALAVGYYDAHGALTYAGKVGTGYTEAVAKKLRARLDKAQRKTSPFVTGGAASERGIRWVTPELVAEIEYAAWTREGILRHAAFKGLREDKDPREVVLESPAETPPDVGFAETTETPPVDDPADPPPPPKAKMAKAKTNPPEYRGVRITSPERVVYPSQGLTKGQLAEYMDLVADRMLPFVANRPLGLVRCPEGRGDSCFFQRHPGMGLAKSVASVPVEEKGKRKAHVMVTDAAGLIGLAQSGVMEIHPWGARADDLAHPDVMILDLDPDPAVPFDRVKEAAREVKQRLADLGLDSLVKTTGGKGLHVVVPLLQRRNDWAEVKGFSQKLARQMAADDPDTYVAVMTKAKRTGRIYVDYLRNGHGSTAIAPYSTRSREGAPVAAPIAWDELARLPSGARWTVETLPARLKRLKAHPWAGYWDLKQSLTRKALKAVGLG